MASDHPTEYFVLNDSTLNEEVVRISKEGKLWINPKYNVDEAALKFWSAVMKISEEYLKLKMAGSI